MQNLNNALADIRAHTALWLCSTLANIYIGCAIWWLACKSGIQRSHYAISIEISNFVSNTYIFTCLSFYTSLEVQQELVFSSKRFDHTAMIFFSGNTIQHINRHSYRNTNDKTDKNWQDAWPTDVARDRKSDHILFMKWKSKEWCTSASNRYQPHHIQLPCDFCRTTRVHTYVKTVGRSY